MTESTRLTPDHRCRVTVKCLNPEFVQSRYTLKGLLSILILFVFVLAWQGVVYAGITDDCTQALTPEILNEEWARSWWVPRHEEKLEDSGRENTRLLFLGDSITQGWENAGEEIWNHHYAKYGSFNLGFSGDRTENVLWRLQNGQVEGMSPKLTVLMIGTNNTGHRQDSPECTARGIEVILRELKERLPDTRILLLAIFPRGETPDHPLRELNEEINAKISAFADEQRVFFLNINNAFLDEEGRLPEAIMPDMLHPNTYGYEIWAEEMGPTLRLLLSE